MANIPQGAFKQLRRLLIEPVQTPSLRPLRGWSLTGCCALVRGAKRSGELRHLESSACLASAVIAKKPGGLGMIVRLWHGRTNTRTDKDAAHFLLITLWDSMESVKKFAGEHPEKAKYYPEDDAFLLEKEETSALYEVFFEK
jgi:heme-degrading monooxygenase HmoA